jgi:hypothetical protein
MINVVSTSLTFLFMIFKGVQSTRGALILFADADGATKFADLEKLEDNMKNLVNGNIIC